MAKILIIDDDPDIVLAARLCLESAGHKVFDANNSARGLGMLDCTQARSHHPRRNDDHGHRGFSDRAAIAQP